jgi:hypothetical protein
LSLRHGAGECALRGLNPHRRLAGCVAAFLLLSAPGCTPSTSIERPQPRPAATVFSQTFDNGQPCPPATDPALPAGIGCVSGVSADLERNGSTDRFLVYARLGPDRRPTSWWAVAVLSGGPSPPAPVPTGQGVPDIYPRVIGAADANHDGAAEVVVKLSGILYHVGGQQIAGMYGVRDGRILAVRIAGRGRLVFRLGGISRYGDGGLCTLHDGLPVFVIRHIEQVLPASWRWTERPFRWRGLVLHASPHRTGLLPVTLPITDPRVEPFYQLRCGSIREP